MPNLSISEAAKLAGVARSNFYTTYIKKGRISVSKDSNGKKFIELSELLRVFPNAKQDTKIGQQDRTETIQIGQNRTVSKSPDNSEIKLLKQQIEDLKADKAWLQDQVTNLTDSIKLLEAPKHHRHWWLFWK